MLNTLLKNRLLNTMNEEQPFKKVVFFQNPKTFVISSLIVENFNPDHKFYIFGFKKHKYRKNETKHYEKIAMLIRFDFISIIIAFAIMYLVITG